MTEAQQKAKRKYLAKGKRIILELYPTEADLIAHIEKQPNKQGYIKQLIKEDIEKEKRDRL
jgi:vacuolar-type H+-ATPase subunit E/Vma4